MTLNIELLKQLATVDGMLAGLALAATVRFVTGNKRKGLISATIATLLVASLALVTTSSLAVLLMGYTSANGAIPEAVELLSSLFIILSLLGLTAFLAGTALVGWVWSRRLGIALSVAASIAAFGIWGVWIFLP